MAFSIDLEMASHFCAEAISLRRQALRHRRLKRSTYSEASYKALWHDAKWKLSLARIRMDMYKADKEKGNV